MADGTPGRRKRIIDSFAGGGGASTGIRWATGRDVDAAINHDETAIAVHTANHPGALHFCEDVYQVDPRTVFPDDDIEILWGSPDCKHFSRAKGGKPVNAKVRGLAWIFVMWARRRKPRILLGENVPEFTTWGPLLPDGTPDPDKRGLSFRQWVGYLRAAGYEIEWRELVAADYGAPTKRKRFFFVARCDGRPIVWPTPTHVDPDLPTAVEPKQQSLFAHRDGATPASPTSTAALKPWRTAAECIDFDHPAPSIFDRARPLADNTLARIAEGMRRYVVDNPRPFVVSIDGERIAAPMLIQTGYGEREGQTPRALDINRPLGTIVAGGCKHALVMAFLARHYTGVVGQSLEQPMSTVTAIDHHSLVTALLIKFYGNEQGGQPMDSPIGTVTTRDRFGFVTVTIDSEQFVVVDIGMRMLTPRECARAQGFPDDYILDAGSTSKTAQMRLVGNSVVPHLAEALVRANFPEGVTAT